MSNVTARSRTHSELPLVRFARTIAFSAAVAANVAFSKPVQFSEAQQSRQVRTALPTTFSSADLAEIDSEILERALFSARVTSAEFLQELDDVLAEFINGDIDAATARLQLSEKLQELGYRADAEQAGDITDLRSDARLNLMLKTNADVAAGYGQWIQGQNEAVLDQWPAQELYRAFPRRHTRDQGPTPWHDRWQLAGGKLAAGSDGGRPRMIALKNDSVWDNLGSPDLFDDGLGNPYPPFAFNSGMDVRDISRKEAISLGLIDRDTQVPPQTRGFNQDLQLTPDIRSDALRQVLQEDGYTFRGKVLVL